MQGLDDKLVLFPRTVHRLDQDVQQRRRERFRHAGQGPFVESHLALAPLEQLGESISHEKRPVAADVHRCAPAEEVIERLALLE